MRKAAIVRRVAEALGSTNVQAEAAVEAVMATMKEALQQGEPVILRRFGTWQVHAKRARVARNPKTGAAAADSSPTGRPLCGQPDAEAGGGRGGQPRGLSQHARGMPGMTASHAAPCLRCFLCGRRSARRPRSACLRATPATADEQGDDLGIRELTMMRRTEPVDRGVLPRVWDGL